MPYPYCCVLSQRKMALKSFRRQLIYDGYVTLHEYILILVSIPFISVPTLLQSVLFIHTDGYAQVLAPTNELT